MASQTDRLNAALAGRYHIERQLGEGGMATVYLCDDLRHDREVALKVLKPELAAVLGAERFVQEIKTTAALQHPHILPLFDSGTADGFLYYVMPYVQGETLRGKLDRETQLGVDEAVRIARDVSDALDYAHRHNVIHRDIKPENILLHDGRPMVADFGIALAVSAAAGGRMTETGLSLGTPHYMSPEQATAEKVIDARSDIYSIGSVLYEMLTGNPPHTGASAQQIIMKIITEVPPPVTQYRKSVPPHVAAAVAKSLEKLPADRFESARAFADALANPAFTTASATAATRGQGGRANVSTAIFGAVAAVAAVAVIVAGWAIATRTPGGPQPVLRVSIELPDSIELVSSQFIGSRIALSPDGSRTVFVARYTRDSTLHDRASTALWVRSRDQLGATQIAGTQGAVHPEFAPDGHRVVFVAGGDAKIVDLNGGLPISLGNIGGTSFGPDNSVIGSARNGLAMLPAGGGSARAISSLNAQTREAYHIDPHVLPNGRGVTFTVQYNPNAQTSLYDIAALDLKTGKHKVLTRGIAARYVAGFLLVVHADGVLTAARFDQDGMAIMGQQVPIATDVLVKPFGGVDLSIAGDGTLIYVAGEGINSKAQLVWVDRTGRLSQVDSTWRASFDGLAVSPDGRKVATSITEGTSSEVWIKELDGPRTKLTFGAAPQYRPAWMPGGEKVSFLTEETKPFSLVAKRADGNGTTERLVLGDRNIAHGFVSPDGKWVIYRTSSIAAGRGDILARKIGDSVSIPLLATPADERHPTLSPDGKWLAYRSTESGDPQVYVRPFPNVSDATWAVSNDGGSDPVWSRSGRELFYINGAGQLVAATVVLQPSFSARTQKVLFTLPEGIRALSSSQRFDVAPGDQRFLMIRTIGSDAAHERRDRLILVTNLVEELKSKVGTKMK